MKILAIILTSNAVEIFMGDGSIGLWTLLRIGLFLPHCLPTYHLTFKCQNPVVGLVPRHYMTVHSNQGSRNVLSPSHVSFSREISYKSLIAMP